MKPQDFVTHGTWWSKVQRFEAIVRRVHRDGSATVETRFALDKNGERTGCYVGVRQRIAAADLQPQT